MGVEIDCIRVVKESISKLGGLDIIINNAVCPPIHIQTILALIHLRVTPGFQPSPTSTRPPQKIGTHATP
jgi:hypothetical protein